MLLAALPFVRFVQLSAGTARPLLQDTQIHAFLGTATIVVILIAGWNISQQSTINEKAIRVAIFNAVSLMTGTGYANADYMQWG